MSHPANGRPILIFGALEPSALAIARETASALGAPLTEISAPAQLNGASEGALPLAMLVAVSADGAAEACAVVRAQPSMAHVPILAMTPKRTEMAFLESYQWGCDDIAAADGAGLARRLHILAGNPPPSAVAPRSTAVVAGGDLRWRAMVARGLRNADVDTVYVGNSPDAVEAAKKARFVVAADDLGPDGAVAAAAEARNAGVGVPWVIVAPPKRIKLARAAATGSPNCAVIDACAPPENAVFIANELASAPARDLRASARLLFATTVAFRAAGRDHDEIGFTYNLSAGGMYVRTLAPLAPGEEVWIELSPPRSERRVRLVGRVAWRRAFGPSGAASVPPGFGLQITDGLANDLARYRAGCDALTESMSKSPTLPPRWRKSIVPSEIAPAIV